MKEYRKTHFNSVCGACEQFVKHREIVYLRDDGAVFHERCMLLTVNTTNDEELADKLGFTKADHEENKP